MRRRPSSAARDRHDAETADRWLDALVLGAATRDLPRDGAYWDAGYAWIAAERAARRPGWA
jgi:hypothetical protein